MLSSCRYNPGTNASAQLYSYQNNLIANSDNSVISSLSYNNRHQSTHQLSINNNPVDYSAVSSPQSINNCPQTQSQYSNSDTNNADDRNCYYNYSCDNQSPNWTPTTPTSTNSSLSYSRKNLKSEILKTVFKQEAIGMIFSFLPHFNF